MNAMPQTTRVGEFIGGKYRIVRVLAEGGMGVVYEAQHAVVKRRFAVKFLRPDLAHQRDLLSRFYREAQAAGALESENIAATIDFGILSDGTPYIVMEYLTGESLRALLEREGRLAPARAADLCVQACRGMEAAHASGIIHRDLKPENLFLCRRDDGTDLLKILDFGIAKLEQIETNNAATRTGAILGTPAYMSPEQARGEKTIDHRTDVYGLAGILFEMLSGKHPHPGDSHNAILHHISTQPAVPLHSVQPDLPAPLATAVEHALASDPANRHASVEAFTREIAPFARRQVWPPAKDTGGASGVSVTSSTPGVRPASGVAPGGVAQASTGPLDRGGSAVIAGPRPRPPLRLRPVMVGAGLLAAVVATAIGISLRLHRRPDPGKTADGAGGKETVRTSHDRVQRTVGDRTLPKEARFFVPATMPGAVQQIATLIKQKAFLDAAPLTAMQATPQGIWLAGGTPDEVRAAVGNVIVRAAPDQRVPVLVANNIPFRDCAQYSAGGATNAAEYKAWIDGFASGIGNGRAVVILEPDSLGIIPYNTTISGESDWCKPTIADAQGRTIPAPGATPSERYALINDAVDSIVARAPNASVYLDGTHAGWLSVGEIASHLVKAGVRRAQGFFVNVANFQPTPQSIEYATWISKCIHYASNPAERGRRLGRYGDCASQYGPTGPKPYDEWAETEKWYVDNVDRAPNPPSGPSALTHFVIDTSRNGRGPMDAARFAAAPYDQPADVIKGLASGNWCNPPDTGLGLRPTANTGVALVDAYLWVKVPGGSDGSCDIAGGARAWDYARYNPWGMEGDAQKHFDPLWGAVDPGAGEWLAEYALQLARNANPPLQAPGPITVLQAPRGGSEVDQGGHRREVRARQTRSSSASDTRGLEPPTGGAPGILAQAPSGRPAGRPDGRAEGHPALPAALTETPEHAPTTARVPEPRAPRITFDPNNPYGD